MPGAIGAGSFWSQMVFYVSGASAQKVADNIQNSWDAIKYIQFNLVPILFGAVEQPPHPPLSIPKVL